MRRIAFCIGVIFIVVRHQDFLAKKKKAYETVLANTPNCATCPLRRLNAFVKTLVAESRLIDEASQTEVLRTEGFR